MLRTKAKWKKGEMARTIVIYCLRVLSMVLVWAFGVKTYAVIRWGATDISDVLVYAGSAFGVELVSLACKRIWAKKNEGGTYE